MSVKQETHNYAVRQAEKYLRCIEARDKQLEELLVRWRADLKSFDGINDSYYNGISGCIDELEAILKEDE